MAHIHHRSILASRIYGLRFTKSHIAPERVTFERLNLIIYLPRVRIGFFEINGISMVETECC